MGARGRLSVGTYDGPNPQSKEDCLGTSGDFGPAFFSAVDVRTGEEL